MLSFAACSQSAGFAPAPKTPDANASEQVSPEMQELKALVLPKTRVLRPDPTNRYADDPAAAALGKKFFFDTRFSGPLLDDANNGLGGTLGQQGEVGKVACASCHIPQNRAFVDTRSSRNQLSFASGWTHRKAPSLLDVAEAKFLTWDGRRDTAYSQPFAPLESALEMNSSRLFAAQQIARLYKDEYEAVFGLLPDALNDFPTLKATEAGCMQMPADPVHDTCALPGADNEDVTRVFVNFGKAIQAFTRQLTCGRSRFDEWVDGDASALTSDEQAGALLFVGKAHCTDCHSGPYLTDESFHNVGVPGSLVPFTGVNTSNDPGAAVSQALVKTDWLNSKGRFSDGDDHRLDTLPEDLSSRLGAFRTSSLRCVSRRPSFMHNAEFRSLEDVVRFFSKGGEPAQNFVGKSENFPRDFSDEEAAQLVAFLKALDGTGPDESLMQPPELP